MSKKITRILTDDFSDLDERTKIILKRWKIAEAMARRAGLHRFAEDIAQQVILDCLEEKNKTRKTGWIFIDVVRKMFGSQAIKGRGNARHNAMRSQVSLDKIKRKIQNDPAHDADGFLFPLENLLNLISNPRDREIVELYFKDDLRNVDLARRYDLKEARITQILGSALETMRDYLEKHPDRLIDD